VAHIQVEIPTTLSKDQKAHLTAFREQLKPGRDQEGFMSRLKKVFG
jgi:DnaJ-class molecular chaperone